MGLEWFFSMLLIQPGNIHNLLHIVALMFLFFLVYICMVQHCDILFTLPCLVWDVTCESKRPCHREDGSTFNPSHVNLPGLSFYCICSAPHHLRLPIGPDKKTQSITLNP